MRTIDIHEAKANLFRLVGKAARGQSFLIAISGTPRVMVTPVNTPEASHAARRGLLEWRRVATEDVDPSTQAEIGRLLVSHDVAAAEDCDCGWDLPGQPQFNGCG